jgi:hypothetical protein
VATRLGDRSWTVRASSATTGEQSWRGRPEECVYLEQEGFGGKAWGAGWSRLGHPCGKGYTIARKEYAQSKVIRGYEKGPPG